MYSGVATGIFAIRNADKTMNDNIGRLPVTVGQSAAIIKAGSEYADKSSSIFKATKAVNNTDKVLKGFDRIANYASKKIKTVLNTLDDVAKSDKVFNGISKTVKFASDHVNPLIVASSGVNVLTSDDKKSAIITEAGCLAGMFMGEGWMKKNLDRLLTKLPVNKKWIPVIKGVTFVCGSIAASTAGQKIGKKVAEYWDKPLVADKTAKNEQAKSPQKAYTPMNIKA